MKEDIFDKLRQLCPALEIQSGYHCLIHEHRIKCCQKNCLALYWIQAINKEVFEDAN